MSRSLIATFVERLKVIGINVAPLSANYPWIYLTEINGTKVIERFQANHGFTAFMLNQDNSYTFTDRREIFNLIRKHTKDTS